MFTLQFLVTFLLLCAALVFLFMVACTAFVVISFVHGDIKIKIIRKSDEDDKQ